MWSGRDRLVGVRDVLVVPPDVRRNLAAALPASEFTVYGLSWHHAGAVTSTEDGPYEIYVPYNTARNELRVVEALAGTKSTAREAMLKLLPEGCAADPSLPVCRDVWSTCRGRPFKQRALDILFGAGEPQSFPLVANVFLFADTDHAFAAPLSIDLNVPLTFQKQTTVTQ